MTDTSDVFTPRDGGIALFGPGDRYRFLVTGEQSGGSLFLMECDVPHGGGPPPHIHHRETESFYVVQGLLAVTVGERKFECGVGDTVIVPKGVAHSFANIGDGNAKMLAIFTPAGMEGWFSEVLPPAVPGMEPPPPTPELIEKMLEAGPRHGVEWVLPG